MAKMHDGLSWIGVACLALLWAVPVVRAQTLGEVAAREKERRAREAEKGKASRPVISDEDLKRRSGKTASPAQTEGQTGASASESASSSGASDGAAADADANKSYWRSRIEAAKAAADQAEKRAQEAEVEARGARGGPSASDYSQAVAEGAERKSRIDAAEAARRDADAARQALADLENEARSAGGL
jgi:hypothetical protein